MGGLRVTLFLLTKLDKLPINSDEVYHPSGKMVYTQEYGEEAIVLAKYEKMAMGADGW